MENYFEDRKEDAAVDEIMAALGLEEEEAPEAVTIAETGVQLSPGSEPLPALPRIIIEEVTPDMTREIAQDRRELGLLNAAIEGIRALEEVDCVQEHAGTLCGGLYDKLREIRMNEYEHLVNWDAIAKG